MDVVMKVLMPNLMTYVTWRQNSDRDEMLYFFRSAELYCRTRMVKVASVICSGVGGKAYCDVVHVMRRIWGASTEKLFWWTILVTLLLAARLLSGSVFYDTTHSFLWRQKSPRIVTWMKALVVLGFRNWSQRRKIQSHGRRHRDKDGKTSTLNI